MDETALRETILAQYANSPRLLALISTFSQAASSDEARQTFLDRVWDPATASGWGLDVWGRIVGIGRVVPVRRPQYVGFDEADNGTGSVRPFNYGIWYHGVTVTDNERLSDDAYRQAILAKAAANISNGSIADINRILMLLFGDRGRIYLAEGTDAYIGWAEARNGTTNIRTFNDGIFWSADLPLGADALSMTICHSWDLSPLEATIIQSGILPRPSGVTLYYRRV